MLTVVTDADARAEMRAGLDEIVLNGARRTFDRRPSAITVINNPAVLPRRQSVEGQHLLRERGEHLLRRVLQQRPTPTLRRT